MGRAERFASIALVAFGLGVMYYAKEHLKLGMLISPGAGFVPFWVGTTLAVLGALWFAMTLLAGPKAAPEGGEQEASAPAGPSQANRTLTRLVPGVALVLAYAWLFERAGFFASTVFFMVGWQKIVEREKWGKALVIALVCAGVMYALFSYLLKGVLPLGAWFA